MCAAAHPRSRGEHPQITSHRPRSFGSSPLARGTPHRRHRRQPAPRLIPARAGNTSCSSLPGSPPSAHPRSRGEHLNHAGAGAGVRGSSPLARGTLLNLPSGFPGGRLIPARAGNTSSAEPILVFMSAHPRSRGEHFLSVWVFCRASGSSPLARGTPNYGKHWALCCRLIPARAGNTSLSSTCT